MEIKSKFKCFLQHPMLDNVFNSVNCNMSLENSWERGTIQRKNLLETVGKLELRRKHGVCS